MASANKVDSVRDSGLVRSVGPLGLAASTINVVIGAGIFVLPSAMAAAVGRYAPLAFLGCAFAMAGVVACFAEGGRRIATSGGCYGYIEAAFGARVAFIAGVLLLFSNVLTAGGIAAALADSAASLVSAESRAWLRVLLIIAVLSLLAAVNMRGVATATRFVGIATVLKVGALIVFVIAGATAVHAENWSSTASFSPNGFGRAMILGVFAFTGMEISLSVSGEVRQPERTIPLALITVMTFVTVIYIAIQLVAQGVLGAALPLSAAPLADTMARISPLLRALLLATAAVSMIGYLGTDLLGSPRMVFALARDRLLPPMFGKLSARTHAPYAAILCYTAVAALLALTGTFAELAVMATLASAAIYVAGCAAVWLLAQRGTTAGPRWLTVAATIGVTSMLLLIAVAAWSEIAGLLAVIVLGTLFYWLRMRWLARQSD